MKKTFFYILTATALLSSCKAAKLAKDARDDARKFALAVEEQSLVPHKILVDAETVPVRAEVTQDSADDPAIYLNTENPEQSIIIGTNKKKGLHTYNLNGEELDFVEVGKVNNVNILENFPFKGKEILLVAASNRTTQGISLFELNPTTGKVSPKIGEIKTNVDDVYGFGAYHTGNKFYVISNGKNGVVEQFEINENNGTVVGTKVIERKVKSQPEGMAVDATTNTLFVGVEEDYIQYFNATEQPNGVNYIPSSARVNNSFISYDIEGLAVFNYENKSYLIASIQGSFSYAIFDVTSPSEATYITSFALVDNNSIDGVEETDGLEVQMGNFGAKYPKGILVVQDGFNKTPAGEAEAQNFKIIDIRRILEIL